MKEYLLFHLYGPMASWGDIAVGEYRPTFMHPTKSSILGLLAAALGIRRNEEDPHRQIAESYGYAVRVEAEGTLLRDYHTTQVAPAGSERDRRFVNTRKDQLSEPRESLNTILSTRDYRCDALYTVCLWPLPEGTPPFSLEELHTKLRHPVFTLYLGRKSCPLALPPQAHLVKAQNISEAFSKTLFEGKEILRFLPKSTQINLYWEGEEDPGLPSRHTIVRRDLPLSRARWQFINRTEHYSTYDLNREE